MSGQLAPIHREAIIPGVPSLLVYELGHEQSGIPPEAIELLDVAVEISMIGIGASLNVAWPGHSSCTGSQASSSELRRSVRVMLAAADADEREEPWVLAALVMQRWSGPVAGQRNASTCHGRWPPEWGPGPAGAFASQGAGWPSVTIRRRAQPHGIPDVDRGDRDPDHQKSPKSGCPRCDGTDRNAQGNRAKRHDRQHVELL